MKRLHVSASECLQG